MGCYGLRKLKTANGYKEFAEEKVEDYDSYVEEAWSEYLDKSVDDFSKTLDKTIAPLFKKVVKKYLDQYGGEHEATELADYLEETADILEGADSPFVADDFRAFAEFLPDFEIMDEAEWVESEYEGTIGAMEDACYEEWRDRQMGI